MNPLKLCKNTTSHLLLVVLMALAPMYGRAATCDGGCDGDPALLAEMGSDTIGAMARPASNEGIMVAQRSPSEKELEGITPEKLAIYMQQTGKSLDEMLFLVAETFSDHNVINLLTSNGADANAEVDVCLEIYDARLPCSKGITPLHVAAFHNENPLITDYLIRGGADVSASEEVYGYHPIHYAALNNPNVKVIDVLLEHGEDINAPTTDTEYFKGSTPLHQAAQNNSIQMIRHLVDKGADIRAKSEFGLEPIHAAAQSSDKAAVKYFLDKKVEIDVQNKLGFTPLHVALQVGNSEVAKYLLSRGADASLRNDLAQNSLHLVAQNRRMGIDLVKTLIDAGNDINAQDEVGDTPFIKAVLVGADPDFIRGLAELGAYVDVKRVNGMTAMHFAAGANHRNIETVELLQELGLDINRLDKLGRTPLLLAIGSGAKIEFLKRMLEMGADPSVMGEQYSLESFFAKHQHCEQLMEMLGDKDSFTFTAEKAYWCNVVALKEKFSGLF